MIVGEKTAPARVPNREVVIDMDGRQYIPSGSGGSLAQHFLAIKNLESSP